MYRCRFTIFVIITLCLLPDVFSLICYDCRALSANSDNCNSVDNTTRTERCTNSFECARYIMENEKGQHVLVRRCNYDSKTDCELYPSCTTCSTDYCNNN